MDDASPPKWHLAHTTWFFETFILKERVPGYQPFHPRFEYLFNSYYNGVGDPFPRPQRGHLTRPTVEEVLAYRSHVDNHVKTLVGQGLTDELADLVVLGTHHEQQHQELILTDIKYAFALNPLYPVFGGDGSSSAPCPALSFLQFDGGVVEIGLEAQSPGFKFDNECPRHRTLLHPFQLANRLVSNAEFLDFVRDGGYETSSLWLSEGWAKVKEAGWSAPLYWRQRDEIWFEYRLDGLQPLDPNLPVVHLSAHEAYAYAAWRGYRLPTEMEWEHAAASVADDGVELSYLESERFHPGGYADTDKLQQMRGYAWQWTASSYAPYPGFKPLPGTLGEYNGKFMSSQLVLRGGSCATSASHLRDSYRNFFYPPDRWQFSGLRLAADG